MPKTRKTRARSTSTKEQAGTPLPATQRKDEYSGMMSSVRCDKKDSRCRSKDTTTEPCSEDETPSSSVLHKKVSRRRRKTTAEPGPSDVSSCSSEADVKSSRCRRKTRNTRPGPADETPRSSRANIKSSRRRRKTTTANLEKIQRIVSASESSPYQAPIVIKVEPQDEADFDLDEKEFVPSEYAGNEETILTEQTDPVSCERESTSANLLGKKRRRKRGKSRVNEESDKKTQKLCVVLKRLYIDGSGPVNISQIIDSSGSQEKSGISKTTTTDTGIILEEKYDPQCDSSEDVKCMQHLLHKTSPWEMPVVKIEPEDEDNFVLYEKMFVSSEYVGNEDSTLRGQTGPESGEKECKLVNILKKTTKSGESRIKAEDGNVPMNVRSFYKELDITNSALGNMNQRDIPHHQEEVESKEAAKGEAAEMQMELASSGHNENIVKITDQERSQWVEKTSSSVKVLFKKGISSGGNSEVSGSGSSTGIALAKTSASSRNDTTAEGVSEVPIKCLANTGNENFARFFTRSRARILRKMNLSQASTSQENVTRKRKISFDETARMKQIRPHSSLAAEETHHRKTKTRSLPGESLPKVKQSWPDSSLAAEEKEDITSERQSIPLTRKDRKQDERLKLTESPEQGTTKRAELKSTEEISVSGDCTEKVKGVDSRKKEKPSKIIYPDYDNSDSSISDSTTTISYNSSEGEHFESSTEENEM